MKTLDADRMLNVVQHQLFLRSCLDQETFDAENKARLQITRQLSGDTDFEYELFDEESGVRHYYDSLDDTTEGFPGLDAPLG